MRSLMNFVVVGLQAIMYILIYILSTHCRTQSTVLRAAAVAIAMLLMLVPTEFRGR